MIYMYTARGSFRWLNCISALLGMLVNASFSPLPCQAFRPYDAVPVAALREENRLHSFAGRNCLLGCHCILEEILIFRYTWFSACRYRPAFYIALFAGSVE